MTGFITPKPGKVVVVDTIPRCDICGDPEGRYDFRTTSGRWANGCFNCWTMFSAEMKLGVGSGQLWITPDEAAS